MAHVKNAWYVAGWEQDLEAEKTTAITILNNAIVIYKSTDNEVFALEDRCVHRLAPLSKGRCEGNKLRCMYHGFLYDSDGTVSEIPGQDRIPAKAKIKRYPVVVKHSWIWIWMGDGEGVDESLIPSAVGFDDPNYILGRGQMDYQADAHLIHNNLCDFSHLAYVHPNSFGADESWSKIQSDITCLERGVRFTKWVPNQLAASSALTEGRVDVWSDYQYMVPGILLMRTRSYPAGTATNCLGNEPTDDIIPLFDAFTSQAVTAMTDRTSRYYYSWGPNKNCGDEALRDEMMKIAIMAFTEDKDMIEAQQIVIDRSEDKSILPSMQDRGVVTYSRLCERLAEEEQN